MGVSMIDQERLNVLKCRIEGYARRLNEIWMPVAKWKKQDAMKREAIIEECQTIAIGLLHIRKELKRDMPLSTKTA